MKKRILSLLLAVITILQVIPAFTLPAIAEDETTGIDVADMEVGKLYRAKFMSDTFVPYGRYPFIDSGILDRSQMPRELTVIRESADDYDLVYVTEHTANWPSEYTDYRYVTANKLSIAGGISVDSMEIGQIYTATWNTTDTGVYLYKKIPASESDIFVEYGFTSDDYVEPVVSTDGCPTELIVCVESENDPYVRVTNEDWPNEYAQYRYLDPEYDVVILGEYVPAPDDGLIHGEVGLTIDGKTVTSLSIAEGEKTYVFTELSDKLDGDPTYRWELLIDRESNRWATVQDYVYPYAPISAALIANAGQENCAATLRCIAALDGKNYVSGELDISVDPSLPEPELPLIPTVQSGSLTPLGADAAGSTRAADAFQVNIQYVYWNNSPLPEAGHGKTAMPTYMATVGGANPPLTTIVNSIPIPGYTPYVRIPADELPADYKDYPDVYREYKAREIPEDPNSAEETHYYKKTLSISFNHQETAYEEIVYYLPDLVTFRVNHHIQNLKDDGYTVYKTDEGLTGYSDSPVGKDLELELYGFANLFYDPNTRISASNNTTVDIYYDRNYYLVNFDLSGPNDSEGYGVMPLYVRYETPLQAGTPQNPGYTFNGWNLVNVYTDTDNPDGTEVSDQNTRNQYINPSNAMTIKHNLKYTTNWTVATTTYTVIYWLENADDNAFTLTTFRVVSNVTPGAKVSADDQQNTLADALANSDEDTSNDATQRAEANHFTYNALLSDQNVTVKGDGTTAVNVYYLRNYYNLIFKASKPCEQPEHSHNDECQATCTQEAHLHSEECGVASQTCGKEEHTHIKELLINGGCLSCTIHEHTVHSTECINCGKVEHLQHTTDCFVGVEDPYENWNGEPQTPSGNPPNNPADGYVYQRWQGYGSKYIYVNGLWYEYSGSATSGNIATIAAQCPNNGKLHLHADSCYIDTLHTHIETCYGCGKERHTHTTSCYTYNCGTIEHSHTGSCFSGCQIPVHTHVTSGTNACTGTASKNVLTIRRKYDASLVDIWTNTDVNKVPYIGTCLWATNKANNTYYAFLQKMPGYSSDLILTYTTVNATYTYTWGYALEKVSPDAVYEGKQETQSNGRYYFIDFSSVMGYNSTSLNLTYNEDYFPITGFKQRDSNVPSFSSAGNRAYTATLYYTRNSYNLIFNDGTNEILGRTESILYEADISGKYFVPDIPSNKESGSVKFVGWYTTPTCADGTEFDFAGQIMPARNLTLYAKWEPTYWDVIVYQEKPLDADNPPKVLWEHYDVPFGTLPSSIAAEPSRTPPVQEYIFAGWYYEEEGTGEEKRFDFNTMPIKHKYVIYAKWTSEVPVPFTVRYVTMVDGIEVEIAEPTKGQSLAGISKSFTAKVDKELYEAYQIGYFPTSREQTQIMENKKADEGGNVITFEYVTNTEFMCRIKHVFVSDNENFIKIVGSNTLILTWESTVTTTSSARLKEKFDDEIRDENVITRLISLGYTEDNAKKLWYEHIVNMSPDAFYQSLILVANSTIDHNEVVFNWMAGTTITVYEVHHLYEDENGVFPEYDDNPERYNARYEDGKTTTVDKPTPRLTKGYRYDRYETNNDENALTLKLPTAGKDGLIIKMYYYREDINYSVKYVEENGLQISFDQVVTGTGKYLDELKIGDIVKDIKIPGYELINGNDIVKLEDDNQIIYCEYRKQSASYYYKAFSGSGRFGGNDEINVRFGDQPEGNQALPDAGWILKGWYYGDRFGNDLQAVSSVGATVVDGKLIPRVVSEEDVGKEFFFWAIFVPTTLTITSTIDAGTAIPEWVTENQGFIYKIEGKPDTATEGISLTVAVPVGKTQTVLGLPLGEYNITLEGDWSWRYVQREQDTTFTMEANGTDLKYSYAAPSPDVGQDGYYITDGAYNDPTPKAEP